MMQMFSQAALPTSATTGTIVSILIPVYRNEGGLNELVTRISAAMANSKYAQDFELILVDAYAHFWAA